MYSLMVLLVVVAKHAASAFVYKLFRAEPHSAKCTHYSQCSVLTCCVPLSGTLQVNSTIRLGSSDAANSMQWVSSPEALLLTRGNQTVMLFNSTHTIIFGADGVTSISLGRNATGSFVNIVTDAISRSSVAGRAVTPVLPGDIGLPSTGSGTHLLDPNLVGHLPSPLLPPLLSRPQTFVFLLTTAFMSVHPLPTCPSVWLAGSLSEPVHWSSH